MIGRTESIQSFASDLTAGLTAPADFARDVLASAADALGDARGAALSLTEGYASRVGILSARTFAWQLAGPTRAEPTTARVRDANFDGLFVGADGRTYSPATPLADVPPVTPRDGVRTDETFVYVNGISTTREGHTASLQEIAEQTGGRVVGIYNATGGAFVDIIQSAGDTLDLGHNPAVDTLATTVYEEITAGRNVHLLAHSQGALITSRALQDVRGRLIIEDGLSPRQAERVLARVRVETFGGAAGAYPNGPRYVHYVNRADPVSTLFGLGPFGNPLVQPGRGAVVHRFSERHNSHGFDETYLPRRVPFEQARRGDFD